MSKFLCDYCGGFEIEHPDFIGATNVTAYHISCDLEYRQVCAICMDPMRLLQRLTPEKLDIIFEKKIERRTETT